MKLHPAAGLCEVVMRNAATIEFDLSPEMTMAPVEEFINLASNYLELSNEDCNELDKLLGVDESILRPVDDLVSGLIEYLERSGYFEALN